MTQIEPVVFPLNLGTANHLMVNISANNATPDRIVAYSLFDNTTQPPKRLSSNFFKLTDEQFEIHGGDMPWLINYVATQLGIIIL